MSDTDERPPIHPLIEKLNTRHCLVRVGKDEVILQETPDGVVFQSESAFRLRYRDTVVTVPNGKHDENGNPKLKAVRLGDLWLDSADRRKKDRVVFAPTGYDPRIVRYDEKRDFNLWKGLGVTPDTEPNPASRCSHYLKLLEVAVCDGNPEVYAFFLKLLAWKLQNPGRVSEVVPFLLGPQGIGKGEAIRHYMKLFRTENWAHVANAGHVLGRFNSMIAERVVIFVDEGIDPDNPAHIRGIKNIATNETATVERKGIDAITVPNFAQLFVATNKEHAWATEVGDRRALILQVNPCFKGDHTFFDELNEQMANGGYEALAAFLMTLPVTARELRSVPMTEAKRRHTEQDLPPVEAYLLDRLTGGTALASGGREDHAGREAWEGVTLRAGDWFADFRESNQGRSFAGKNTTERAFSMKLAKLLPKWKLPDKSSRRYLLGDLGEARRHFDQMTKTTRVWEDEPEQGSFLGGAA